MLQSVQTLPLQKFWTLTALLSNWKTLSFLLSFSFIFFFPRPDQSTRVLECLPASAGYHFSTIQAKPFEKVPNYFGIGQTRMTLHDSMHNINREHIAEVKEKEKKKKSNCLKGKKIGVKILAGQTTLEMEIILCLCSKFKSFSFSRGKTVLRIIICLRGF